MRKTRRACVLALTLVMAAPALAQDRSSDLWVATWATALVARMPGQGPPGAGRAQGPAPPPAGVVAAPVQPPPQAGRGRQAGPPPPVTVSNQTLRQIVRTSIGGNRMRVVLSNAFGTSPIEIGAAHVALRAAESTVARASVRELTFGGRAAGTILPGAVLLSDPVNLAVPASADLVVDLYIPGEIGLGTSPVTTHNGAGQTNYLSGPGNHSGAAEFPVAGTANAWFLLARVEVVAPAGTLAVVAFGDSITDGAASTRDANARWPDRLARRLAARRGGPPVAVLNAGISGNRLLGDGAGTSALARFDRDVLMQTGVTHVIILEGINDIGVARSSASPSAEDLIAAHRQLIARARARGLRVYGATLTPFEGAGYWTPEGEAKRRALNEWIRTSGAYDAVIDFDRVTRDPSAPARFLAAYDSGDRLHPGDAGYAAMGDAVDLALFGR